MLYYDRRVGEYGSPVWRFRDTITKGCRNSQLLWKRPVFRGERSEYNKPSSEVRDRRCTSVIHPKSLNSIQIRPACRVQNYLHQKLCGRTFELLRIQNEDAHGPGSPPRDLFKIVIVQGGMIELYGRKLVIFVQHLRLPLVSSCKLHHNSSC